MTEEELQKYYSKSGAKFYMVINIDYYRDGGTMVISTNAVVKFYMSQDWKHIHSDYPLTEENKVTDVEEIKYLIYNIKRYLDSTEKRIKRDRELVDKYIYHHEDIDNGKSV